METVEFELPASVATVAPANGAENAIVATRLETGSLAPTVAGSAHQVMSMIERLTLDTSVPIERAKQAFAFWQEVRADQAKLAFIAAFSKCQAEMEPVAKDASNPQTKSKYATLAALDRAIRPIYTKHGFSVAFDAAESPLPDHVRVLCIVTHCEGHERTHHVDMPTDGKGAKGGDVMTKTHAMGSAFSYGKRYALGNAFNIATEGDDDGNAAGRKRASALITPEQIAELEKIAKDKGASIERFCAYGKVSSLAEIRAEQFDSARNTLLSYRAGGAK